MKAAGLRKGKGSFQSWVCAQIERETPMGLHLEVQAGVTRVGGGGSGYGPGLGGPLVAGRRSLVAGLAAARPLCQPSCASFTLSGRVPLRDHLLESSQ